MNKYELWKPINNHSEYAVSNHGRVRNLITGRILCRYFTNYYRVQLFYGKRASLLVHRLVADAFLKNPLSKPEVNHKDFDPRNCRADNLEYSTRKENSDHAWRNHRYPIGVNHGQAKLTRQLVLAIRKDRATGFSLRYLSEKYGTSLANISAVTLRKSWAHI